MPPKTKTKTTKEKKIGKKKEEKKRTYEEREKEKRKEKRKKKKRNGESEGLTSHIRYLTAAYPLSSHLPCLDSPPIASAAIALALAAPAVFLISYDCRSYSYRTCHRCCFIDPSYRGYTRLHFPLSPVANPNPLLPSSFSPSSTVSPPAPLPVPPTVPRTHTPAPPNISSRRSARNLPPYSVQEIPRQHIISCREITANRSLNIRSGPNRMTRGMKNPASLNSNPLPMAP